jgi:hypothetical protein
LLIITSNEVRPFTRARWNKRFATSWIARAYWSETEAHIGRSMHTTFLENANEMQMGSQSGGGLGVGRGGLAGTSATAATAMK